MFEVVADRPAFRSNSPGDNGTVSVSKESGARSVAFGLCSVDDFHCFYKRIICVAPHPWIKSVLGIFVASDQ